MSEEKKDITEVTLGSGLTAKELKKIEALKQEEDNKGVIYLPRVPPFMKPEKVRHIMSQFGETGRIYLKPEEETEWRKRRKLGGNRARKYIDGWVEFLDKKIAKRVAESLNGTPVGGSKRHNFWRDDLWTVRYLAKFKWHHLTEYTFYKKSVREEKIRAIMTSQRKEQNLLIEQVDKKKKFEKMQEKRAAKKQKLMDNEDGEKDDEDEDNIYESEDDEDDISDDEDYESDDE